MKYTGLTLRMAKERYADYFEAEQAVLLGASYKLSNGEELTRANLQQIRNGLSYWEGVCDELGRQSNGGIKVISLSLK